MTISFDLDDTIIPGTKTFDTENLTLIHRLFGLERIRFGTITLFRELRARNHRIFIYTTSFRAPAKIKLMFYLYGIPVEVAINQDRHDRELKDHKNKASKFPPAFGIDVHVDDSSGLRVEGEKFDFKTIIVDPDDQNWIDTVLRTI